MGPKPRAPAEMPFASSRSRTPTLPGGRVGVAWIGTGRRLSVNAYAGAKGRRSRRRPSRPRRRCSSWARLPEEQAIDGVLGLVHARIGQGLEERPEVGILARRDLEAHQAPPVARTLVAIVEQADVPARVHARQE